MKQVNLPVDKINIPHTRVTSYFDAEVYEEFKRTVATLGVVEPVVVVEVEEAYFLVDGLHRLIEAQGRGDAQIPAVVVPGEEKDILLTNLFLNVLRGRTKVAEIREVTSALNRDYKMDVGQIQSKTGLSQDYINDLLVISELPEDAVKAFDDGRLSKGKARAIARLPSAELQIRVFYQVDGRNLTVQDVEELVDALMEELGKAPPPPPPPGPPEERKLTCDGCLKEHDPKALRSVLLCDECGQIGRAAWDQYLRGASNAGAN